MTTAILALQGAFAEHGQKLDELGEDWFEVRQVSDLDRPFDRLILPGGESTVQAKLLHELGLFEPLKRRIAGGMPVLATCAGLILLADKVEGTGDLAHLSANAAGRRLTFEGLATMPVSVKRNAYGRQLGSFFTRSTFGDMQDVPMTFIRAPYITEVRGEATPLATIDGHVVAAHYKNQLGLAFHPELDNDTRIHELFLSL